MGMFMKGFLHESCFAKCSDGAQKFAMVVGGSQRCPLKVHSKRSTKVFRKMAKGPGSFCPRRFWLKNTMKVCSYCIDLSGTRAIIESFQQSLLSETWGCRK